MNLNKATKVACDILTIVAFFFTLGIAGTLERREQIIYTMPQEAYEQIYLELGDDCSDKQIEKRYMENKKHYDSLSIY